MHVIIVCYYKGWKNEEYSGSQGSSGSSSMTKAQMQMRDALRKADEKDGKLDDANFG